MEIFMSVVMIGMIIYFFKSSDLPKEMKNKSVSTQAELMPIKKAPLKVITISDEVDLKLTKMKQEKDLKEIQILTQEIDKLTFAITTLEQELKVNNSRNTEIQSIIDWHFANLLLLKKKMSDLT